MALRIAHLAASLLSIALLPGSFTQAQPHSVNAEQLQRLVAKDRGESDERVAAQLAGFVLEERLSAVALASLETSVPGPKSRSALVALADGAAFLDPPAADVPSQPAPDLSQQRRILALTVQYLGETLPMLPNFYATRTTIRYNGHAWRKKSANAAAEDGYSWRRAGSSKDIVVYRDGREVVDPRGWGKRSSHPGAQALITRGTFGPILSTVIVDAAHGTMQWDHWERGNAAALAVFRYRVPQNQSHYAVAFQGFASDMDAAQPPSAYHGEVGIDPATGAILRLTVQADPPPGSPILRGDILVEYGPVEIGARTYTCPLHSVSITLAASALEAFAPSPDTTLLNDVTFGDYHLFRAESRILTGDPRADGP